MEDCAIIALYWARDEAAIARSQEKYGGYCRAVAGRLLASPQDAEECVSDTWLAAWGSMPPHRPQALRMFFAKLTRRLAFNRYKANTAEKRGGGQLPLVLEELAECVAGSEDVQQQVEDLQKQLSAARQGGSAAPAPDAIREARLEARKILADAQLYAESAEKELKQQAETQKTRMAENARGIAAGVMLVRDRLARVDQRLSAATLDLDGLTQAIYQALDDTEAELRELGTEMRDFAPGHPGSLRPGTGSCGQTGGAPVPCEGHRAARKAAQQRSPAQTPGWRPQAAQCAAPGVPDAAG